MDDKNNLLQDQQEQRIIFFDGVCVLCNGFVDFLLKKIISHEIINLSFSPLQGGISKRLLPERFRVSLSSVVYWDRGEIYERSEAVLRIFCDLGGFWKLWAIFFIVPNFIRDIVYNRIARNRYLWFGEKESCRLPSLNEKKYFKE